MSQIPTSSITLKEFQDKVTNLLSNNLSVFNGLTISDISINDKISTTKQYYRGTQSSQHNSKTNLTINIYINNRVAHNLMQENPLVKDNAKYDITIDYLKVDNYSTVTIYTSKIRESGLSDRELLNRRLLKYCNDNQIFPIKKRALPRIITNILAITSGSSSIESDIYTNNGLLSQDKGTKIIKCKNHEEIAGAIKEAYNLYDVIVLFRGGHQDDHMNIFSHEKIIDAITKSVTPIAIALGHEVDRPFIYNMADIDATAPSDFAKFVKEHNKSAVQSTYMLFKDIAAVLNLIKNKKEHLLERVFSNIDIQALNISKKRNIYNNTLINKIGTSINEIYRHKKKEIEHISSMITSNVNSFARTKSMVVEKSHDAIAASINTITHNKRIRLEKSMNSINTSANTVLSDKAADINAKLQSIESIVEMIEKSVGAQLIHKRQKSKLIAVAAIAGVIILALILYILFR